PYSHDTSTSVFRIYSQLAVQSHTFNPAFSAGGKAFYPPAERTKCARIMPGSQDAQSAVWQCSAQLAIIMCCIGSPWLLFVATSVVVARSRRLTAYVLCDLSNRVRSESLRKVISRNSWKR